MQIGDKVYWIMQSHGHQFYARQCTILWHIPGIGVESYMVEDTDTKKKMEMDKEGLCISLEDVQRRIDNDDRDGFETGYDTLEVGEIDPEYPNQIEIKYTGR